MDREVGIVLINLKSYFRHWQSTLWPVALTASNDQHPPQRKKKEEKKVKIRYMQSGPLPHGETFHFVLCYFDMLLGDSLED